MSEPLERCNICHQPYVGIAMDCACTIPELLDLDAFDARMEAQAKTLRNWSLALLAVGCFLLYLMSLSK